MRKNEENLGGNVSMLSVLENISIIMFFVLQPLLECFIYWKLQMIHLVGEAIEDEELPLWGLPDSIPSLNKETAPEERVAYQETQLTKEHDLFYESLYQSVAENCSIDSDNPYTYEDTLPVFSMVEASESVSTVKEPMKATARIKDYRMGEQVWTVEVVGEEQGYIHVSDGTARAWLNANEFGQFFKGDILTMLIERKGEQLQILQMELLQRKSKDFLIYDEEEEAIEHLEAITA